ncbi:unnamed protein product [Sphenostylis stenocarpa]|uniref:Uncharacterized protein n=1 Tax=Sphenostylis stenocarpa TaxID=92480 RepID=A0AA86VLP9_9FABA|nr:unnamed protein product [Sphenostylis stenocarpa]
MAAWTVAAHRATNMTQLSTLKTASLLHRRGLAGAADHHGPPKVNFWQDPTSPSKWKEEHFVILSLTGWGLLFYGGYKLFTGGKGKNEEVHTKLEHQTRLEVVTTSAAKKLFYLNSASQM